MRIFLHAHDGYATAPYVAMVREALDATPSADMVAVPDQADVVLLLPTFASKFRGHARTLNNDPVVADYLDRVLVYESCDGPTDYLRGVYCNLTLATIDPLRHRAIGFAQPSQGLEGKVDPSLLYSFRGALSHPVRKSICDLLANDGAARVTPMNRWMNYSEEEKQAFWREVRESAFVLCPRGLGPSSHRLQETMQAGRVPVILADDWIAPSGPVWDEFSVRCPESDVWRLPELLRERHRDAAEMGCIARLEWERFYAPGEPFGSWLVALLQQVIDQTPPEWSPTAERARWGSFSFRWRAGYDPAHRIVNKARVILQAR